MSETAEKLPLCPVEPQHYCRVDRNAVKRIMERIAACESAQDRGGAMKAYITLGNMAVAGCPSIRIYSRKSVENLDLAPELEAELIGLRVLAQQSVGVKPVAYFGMGWMTLRATIDNTRECFENQDRNGAVRNCITLGKMYAQAKPDILEGREDITKEDVAEEIGLHIFILHRIGGGFMPDPDVYISLCGTGLCPFTMAGPRCY